jgi:hypothetical protein
LDVKAWIELPEECFIVVRAKACAADGLSDRKYELPSAK